MGNKNQQQTAGREMPAVVRDLASGATNAQPTRNTTSHSSSPNTQFHASSKSRIFTPRHSEALQNTPSATISLSNSVPVAQASGSSPRARENTPAIKAAVPAPTPQAIKKSGSHRSRSRVPSFGSASTVTLSDHVFETLTIPAELEHGGYKSATLIWATPLEWVQDPSLINRAEKVWGKLPAEPEEIGYHVLGVYTNNGNGLQFKNPAYWCKLSMLELFPRHNERGGTDLQPEIFCIRAPGKTTELAKNANIKLDLFHVHFQHIDEHWGHVPEEYMDPLEHAYVKATVGARNIAKSIEWEETSVHTQSDHEEPIMEQKPEPPMATALGNFGLNLNTEVTKRPHEETTLSDDAINGGQGNCKTKRVKLSHNKSSVDSEDFESHSDEFLSADEDVDGPHQAHKPPKDATKETECSRARSSPALSHTSFEIYEATPPPEIASGDHDQQGNQHSQYLEVNRVEHR
ncbi:hypothetical protein EJ08DRAFT_662713 [Tothia fuscella]|uniref:Uncharacterized protein n=1 Tax=Tothia fuscella TaxID=1048955 RepID=A0A9P4NN05_9PEZI|nr:hypothetical protein EJ08DRAFT_662713 [Tothia fuscella]